MERKLHCDFKHQSHWISIRTDVAKFSNQRTNSCSWCTDYSSLQRLISQMSSTVLELFRNYAAFVAFCLATSSYIAALDKQHWNGSKLIFSSSGKSTASDRYS